IQARDIAAAFLPYFDTARVNELDAVTLRRAQKPGGVGPEFLHVVGCDLSQDIVIVPEEDKEAFIDNGRIVKLLVRMPRPERRDELAILDPNILRDSVDAVTGIIDVTVSDFQQSHT